MTDAINSNSRVRTATPATEHKGQATPTSSSKQGSNPASSTVVDIKSTKILESMAQEIEKVPDMDMAKIDSIKQAISNGDYQTNADVIAQKFIEIEKLL